MRVHRRTAELAQKNLQIQEQAKTLEMTNRDLRELSARLLQVQDNERRRIARDLHDSTGQILALLSMTLSGLQAEARKFSPGLADGLGAKRGDRQTSFDGIADALLLAAPAFAR